MKDLNILVKSVNNRSSGQLFQVHHSIICRNLRQLLYEKIKSYKNLFRRTTETSTKKLYRDLSNDDGMIIDDEKFSVKIMPLASDISVQLIYLLHSI